MQFMGVDGSPTVKDIYFDDTPTTESIIKDGELFFLSGLGAGGKGFFRFRCNRPK